MKTEQPQNRLSRPMSPITPSSKNSKYELSIAEDTSISHLNENIDFKIGLGGMAIVKEEALRIPLYGEKNPIADLNLSDKTKADLKKIIEAKPEWSRYNSFQPDWAAFQTEIKQMMISTMEPAMRSLFTND